MNYRARQEIHPDNEFLLATIKRRFIAFLIDWIILGILYFSIILVFAVFDMNLSTINVHSIFDVDMEMTNAPARLIPFLKILFGLLPVLYFTILFYFFKGQTIGKYFLRMRVLSLHHEHLGLWHCIERSLGYFASALEFGFGYMQAFWNPNRMALHDKMGETIVIQLRSKKQMNKIQSR